MLRIKPQNLIRFGSKFVSRSPNRICIQAFSVQKDDDKNTEKKPVEVKGNKFVAGAKSAFKTVADIVKNPKKTWIAIKEEIHHYWIGSKLLWSEIKVANEILNRVIQGHGMTRRERMQLLRTTTDIFRLVPFAIFVIVPFMEFLLPFALKLFPNMLPSTFQDNLKKEEGLKKELQMRLAVAKFMQETLQEMATKKSSSVEGDDSSGAEVINFIEKARLGEPISNETVIRIARLFKDELTLANVTRPQLVSMCRYMGLQPYGADAFLRFLLRTKFKGIKEDDRRILWEGIDSLNTTELRDASSERGMRSYGLTHFKLKHQLDEWLSLSIQKNIPISLLIMSRAFMLTSPSDDAEQMLKTSIGSLDLDTINEVVIAVASPGEENTKDIRMRKLESIAFQKEMIEEEREEKNEALDDHAADKLTAQQLEDTANPPPLQLEIKHHIPHEASHSIDDLLVPPVVVKENRQELTLYEIQAISDLARGSSVLREKTELAILQANVEQAISKNSKKLAASAHADADLLGSGLEKGAAAEGVVTAEEQKKEKKTADAKVDSPVSADDKGLVRMTNAVNTMLDKLKMKIDSTEKALGDKLNLLDKDGDGELSSEELKEAIVKILKRTSSLQEANDLIAVLDSNKDGKVSLAELLAYIKKRSDRFEVDALEAQINKIQQINTQTAAVNTVIDSLPAPPSSGSSSVNSNMNSGDRRLN